MPMGFSGGVVKQLQTEGRVTLMSITIVSRKKFHFHNPDPAMDLLKVNLDAAASGNREKYNEAVFVTNGNMELQTAPEWINKKMGLDPSRGVNEQGVRHTQVDLNERNLLTWAHALKDGDIYQVNVVNGDPQTQDMAVSADAQQAENARAAKLAAEAEEKKNGEALAATQQMTGMTKPQIVQFAKASYQMDLDEKLSKEQMIEAVRTKILA